LRSTKEVELPITREMGHRIDVALRQQREAALAGGEPEFTGVAGRNILERNIRVGRRSDIGAEEGAAGNTFQCQEAAGRDCDPFKPNRGWTKGGCAANLCLGCGEAARAGLWRNADPRWIDIYGWSGSWWWRRLLRCLLAEFFLGRLLLAALLGDSLLELFEPLLEQTNLGGRVIGACRDGLARKRPRPSSGGGSFLNKILILMGSWN